MMRTFFLLEEKFWDAKGSWKDFLEGRKLKWASLDCYINISFANAELSHLHLYLHAPKLDVKGASVQLLGAYTLSALSSELMEADFLACLRLADAITNWTFLQALLKALEASYKDKFLTEIPADFVNHIEASRVLSSSLLTEVRLRTEEFFKTRKACHDKVFTACSLNLRA